MMGGGGDDMVMMRQQPHLPLMITTLGGTCGFSEVFVNVCVCV